MMMVIPTFWFFGILMLVTFASAVAAVESNTRTTTNVEPLLENAEERAPTAEKFTLASLSSSSSSSSPRTTHRYMSHRHRSRIDLAITNATPSPVSYIEVYYAFCEKDESEDGIAAGATWMAPARGACFVTELEAALVDAEDDRRPKLECTPFTSSPGTRQADYRIIMNEEEDVCCVRSSQESQECPAPKVEKLGRRRTWVYPKKKRGRNNYDL